MHQLLVRMIHVVLDPEEDYMPNPRQGNQSWITQAGYQEPNVQMQHILQKETQVLYWHFSYQMLVRISSPSMWECQA